MLAQFRRDGFDGDEYYYIGINAAESVVKSMKLLITIFVVLALACSCFSLLSAFAESTPQTFDKEACYAKCGCATGMFTACAECRSACDRAFWKAWNKELDKGTSSKKSDKKSK